MTEICIKRQNPTVQTIPFLVYMKTFRTLRQYVLIREFLKNYFY